MGAIRGLPDDYDRWADEFGCAGWGWAEMLETFLAVEDDTDYGKDDGHGSGGPIPLCRTPIERRAPFDLAMIDAMTALGYPVCDDYHAPGATGTSRWALTVRDGRRVSTNDAYLEPIRARPNLRCAATCWSIGSFSRQTESWACERLPARRSPHVRSS